MSEKKILIVDDEFIGRQLLQALLIVEGYKPILAENGQEALELAKNLKPDLILMDIIMPNINGFEVTKQLRSDSDFKDTPIILITALDDRDSVIEGKEAGANEYISKPFNREEVLDIINRFLNII